MIIRNELAKGGAATFFVACDSPSCEKTISATFHDYGIDFPGPGNQLRGRYLDRLRKRGWSIGRKDSTYTYCPDHTVRVPEGINLEPPRPIGRPRKGDLTGDTPAQKRKRMLAEKAAKTEARRERQRIAASKRRNQKNGS
ncbi:hypothetical protein SEA_MARIETTA_2 [Gordonia phage Marietta]|uniref:Uncharacterized protein n=1 Tax=Gordonia phage Marietta TaxID=2301558 RepID=A0A385DRJ9_9CAUD|nr:hypothetical protein KNU07_gp02 [Gordonia phage Marietta]AXQ61322.1 hypothetical protein SEA_MARIETTA_2 [Gordonia phage Marietta]